jgi:hypothetical protein
MTQFCKWLHQQHPANALYKNTHSTDKTCFMHEESSKTTTVTSGHGLTLVLTVHTMEAFWEGGAVSIMPQPHFTPRERTPSTHCTGG